MGRRKPPPKIVAESGATNAAPAGAPEPPAPQRTKVSQRPKAAPKAPSAAATPTSTPISTPAPTPPDGPASASAGAAASAAAASRGAPATTPKKKVVRYESTTRPSRPSWLSKDAKKMWNWLVPQLDEMGVLTKLDGPLLARYCESWSFWKRTAQFLDKYGDTYIIKDSQGLPRIFMGWPQLTSYIRYTNVLSRMEQELGMSPSARSRIQLDVMKQKPRHYRILEKYSRGSGPQPPRHPLAGTDADFFDGGGPDAPRQPRGQQAAATGEDFFDGPPRSINSTGKYLPPGGGLRPEDFEEGGIYGPRRTPTEKPPGVIEIHNHPILSKRKRRG